MARDAPRHRPRNRAGRASASALLAIVLIAIGVYFGFTKDIPFTHGYYLARGVRVLEQPAAGLAGADRRRERRQGQERRALRSDTDLTDVTMEIDDAGPADPQDATLKIRPRIFLEGNFFVDLQPGLAVRAGGRRRRHDRLDADVDAGPARPAAHRAAVRPARGPADAAEGSARRSTRSRPRRRTRDLDADVRGQDRARRGSTRRYTSGPTRSGAPRSSTARCSAPSRTTSRADRRGSRA